MTRFVWCAIYLVLVGCGALQAKPTTPPAAPTVATEGRTMPPPTQRAGGAMPRPGPKPADTPQTLEVAATPRPVQGAVTGTPKLSVSWVNPEDPTVTGVRIERCQGAGCTPSTTLATLPAGSTAYEDKTVTPGVTYTYQARAVNPVGPSAPSNKASGVAQATVPVIAFNVAWQPPSAPPAGGYEIQKKVGTGAYIPGGTVPSTATSWKDAPVTAGEARCYQVRSLGAPAGNNSTWTTEVCKTASTPTVAPDPPTGVTIQEVVE